jgi:hypothetical protein
MTKHKMPIAQAAKQGEKTIEVTIRFWTDGITTKKNSIIPKHAWDYGAIYLHQNGTHGIKPASPKPFNSILDLTSVLSQVLVQHGITLHGGRKLRKLISK